MAETNYVKERRLSLRVPIVFPVEIENGINIGETVNLSETGLCLAVRSPLESTKITSVQIDFPFSSPFKSEVEVIWNRSSAKNDRFLYGGRFVKVKNEELSTLQGALFKCNLLNSDFISSTGKMRSSLFTIKQKFDQFDRTHKSEKKRIKFVEKNKQEVYSELNTHFNKVWELVKNLNKDEYKLHQEYYQKMLWCLLRYSVETNMLVCQKPLGYAGDFLIMNYFYDFFNKYLGHSSYEKLINFYTCNIPIARSVVERKNFFKQRILETLRSKAPARVLNVASGSCRELIELTREGKITHPLYFDCLDFEKEALEHTWNEIEKIELKKRAHLHLRLIHKNILSLLRAKNIGYILRKYDLVYSAGLFDYLSNRAAQRTIETLYKFLGTDSTLIVTNAIKDGVNHRPYYEILGEWHLKYRTREEMINWTKNLQYTRDIKFEDSLKKNSFLFLSITKAF